MVRCSSGNHVSLRDGTRRIGNIAIRCGGHGPFTQLRLDGVHLISPTTRLAPTALGGSDRARDSTTGSSMLSRLLIVSSSFRRRGGVMHDTLFSAVSELRRRLTRRSGRAVAVSGGVGDAPEFARRIKRSCDASHRGVVRLAGRVGAGRGDRTLGRTLTLIRRFERSSALRANHTIADLRGRLSRVSGVILGGGTILGGLVPLGGRIITSCGKLGTALGPFTTGLGGLTANFGTLSRVSVRGSSLSLR